MRGGRGHPPKEADVVQVRLVVSDSIRNLRLRVELHLNEGPQR